MKTLKSIAAAAFALTLTATTVPAQPFGPMPPERPRHNVQSPRGPMGDLMQMHRELVPFWEDEELVEAIGLTDGQIDLLEENLAATEAALEGLEGTVRDAYRALHETVKVDSPDIDDVNTAIDEATAARNELMKVLIGHRVVVKNVLTADQEEALREYRRERIRERLPEVLAALQELRSTVRELLSDGELSESDWEQINALLEDAPERAQDRIRDRIERFEDREPGAPAGERKPMERQRARQGKAGGR